MRVVKPSTIRRFADEFPDAANALEGWLKVTRAADWQNIQDVRRQIPNADGVVVESGNTVTVFNIRGGHYRLIVSIKYQWRMVYVLRFLTHREYDKDQWKEQL